MKKIVKFNIIIGAWIVFLAICIVLILTQFEIAYIYVGENHGGFHMLDKILINISLISLFMLLGIDILYLITFIVKRNKDQKKRAY